jgi:hypothetical protein
MPNLFFLVVEMTTAGISERVYASSSYVRGRCVVQGLIVLDLVRVSLHNINTETHWTTISAKTTICISDALKVKMS